MRGRTWMAGASAAWLALLLAPGGCRSDPPSRDYQYIEGRVVGRRSDAGEITVEGRRSGSLAEPRAVRCAVGHAEIFIGAQLEPMESIRLNDTVRLIGYPVDGETDTLQVSTLIVLREPVDGVADAPASSRAPGEE